jgi:membrane-associated protein
LRTKSIAAAGENLLKRRYIADSEMSWINTIIDFVLHIDKYIGWIIKNFGIGVYLALFIVIFCETGLVFTPFLPGDSLLFVAGTFAGSGAMNIIVLMATLILAAVLGDTVNFWAGTYFGEKVLTRIKYIKKEHIQKTKDFYRKYGGKTIIIARFVPVVRTLAPFVAGIGKMRYSKFLSYNIIGGALWVSLFLLAGYFFGGLSIVRDNLSLVMITIIIISFLPMVIEFVRGKRRG